MIEPLHEMATSMVRNVLLAFKARPLLIRAQVTILRLNHSVSSRTFRHRVTSKLINSGTMSGVLM